MASPPSKFYNSKPSNFQDEYMRLLEDRHNISINSLYGMGDTVSKLRSKSTENASPKRLNNSELKDGPILSPNKRLSLSPNGKIQSKPRSKQKGKERKNIRNSKTENNARKQSSRILMNQAKAEAERKRKLEETDDTADVLHVAKKRKINDDSKQSKEKKRNRSTLEKSLVISETLPNLNCIVGSDNKVLSPVKSNEAKNCDVKHSSESAILPRPNFIGTQPKDAYFGINRENGADSCKSELLSWQLPENRIHEIVRNDIETFDQNLNKISNCIRNDNFQHLYDKKLLQANIDSSPFKGKMSAFEISLLKGKQNLERRKSLESASLRSSPRTNKSNGPRPNYSDTKRQKARRSLDKPAMSKRDKAFTKTKLKHAVDIARKRKRTSSSEQSLSQSSPLKKGVKLERGAQQVNSTKSQEKTQSPRVKKVVRQLKKKLSAIENDSPSKRNELSPSKTQNKLKAFDKDRRKSEKGVSKLNYRMNGSKKRNSLPARLTIHSLSGSTTKKQGKSSISIKTSKDRQRFLEQTISGTPPPLISSKRFGMPDASVFIQPSTTHRPSSLPLKTAEANDGKEKDQRCSDLGTSGDTPSHDNSTDKAAVALQSISTKSRQRALEETINMLRERSSSKTRGSSESPSTAGALVPLAGRSRRGRKASVSPSRSETPSLSSRRSSRSTTPNMTPVKTDILTPRSTPCSSPEKSPCGTPTSSLGSPRKKKKKTYLFAKGDEVLARWHDGRFYLGTILKIRDSRSKCLLKYEDESKYWSMFKDIHRVLKDDEMVCCVCLEETSEPPNEIVLCEYCFQGYHQKCHTPDISAAKIVNPNEPWFCRQCVFLRAVQVGGAVKEGKWAHELKKVKLALPYKLEDLTWDVQHKNNSEMIYCYCGGPGSWDQKMLQCCKCKQWYHEACLQCNQYPLVFGDSFFIFVCAGCNMGTEYMKRLEMDWVDVMHICLFNLMLEHHRKYYDLHQDIIPWLFERWEQFLVPQMNSLSEEDKMDRLLDTLLNNPNRFVSGAEIRKKGDIWGLRVRSPPGRIHVSLPVSGKITDQVINKLKMKGRRSKVFVSPEEEAQTALANIATKKLKQADKDIQKSTSTPSSIETPSEPLVELPLLDKLIPPKSHLAHPLDHPFLLGTEVDALDKLHKRRLRVWNRMCFHDEMEDPDKPPVLQKEEPIAPVARGSGTPPMPIMDTAMSSGNVNSNNAKEKTNRRLRKSRSSVAAADLKGVEIPEDLTIKRVTPPDNYFCAFDKSGFGRGFYVLGKRSKGGEEWDHLLEGGDTEYLIKWDQ